MPKLAKPYSNRGTAYFHTEELKLAMKDYIKAIELDPYDPDAYYNRAELWSTRGEWTKARPDFEFAKSKGTDLYAAFKNEHKSIKDFESKYNVEVPSYIKDMLRQEQLPAAQTGANRD